MMGGSFAGRALHPLQLGYYHHRNWERDDAFQKDVFHFFEKDIFVLWNLQEAVKKIYISKPEKEFLVASFLK